MTLQKGVPVYENANEGQTQFKGKLTLITALNTQYSTNKINKQAKQLIHNKSQ